MPRQSRSSVQPKRKSAVQLNREISAALAEQNNDKGGMERVTRERVLEPLINEHVTGRQQIKITLVSAVGPEPWELTLTEGKTPPYGVIRGGRILIGPLLAPLAGLAYAIEHGRPYVHHIWVDPEARGRGLSQVLFDAYQAKVSPELIVVGPFTKAGRAAAERAGAILEE